MPCVKSGVAASTRLFSLGFNGKPDFIPNSIGVRMWNLLATSLHVKKRGIENSGTTFNLH